MAKTLQDFINLGGWNHNPVAVGKILDSLPHPLFGPVGSSIKESGKDKVVLLYDCVIKILGKFNVRTQSGPDCVSFGAAAAVDNVKAVEIILKHQLEEWIAETSTEDIYGGSRINIGKGQLGNDGGSYGAWAAKYVQNYGTLVRIKYNNYDLTKYDYGKSSRWGSPGGGVPEELLDIAKNHTIKTVSLISTYEEARDALANGYAVTIASNQGFSNVRDKEGFAAPAGNWAHQMVLIGVDDIGQGCSKRRPGCLVQNSWGVWNSGPKRHNQPDGSFWVDADVLESNILSKGDSWAFSDYEGFPPKKINTRII